MNDDIEDTIEMIERKHEIAKRLVHLADFISDPRTDTRMMYKLLNALKITIEGLELINEYEVKFLDK